MPFRIVLVTSPPAKYAPANSKIIAMIIACLMVMALEPTEVPHRISDIICANTPRHYKSKYSRDSNKPWAIGDQYINHFYNLENCLV